VTAAEVDPLEPDAVVVEVVVEADPALLQAASRIPRAPMAIVAATYRDPRPRDRVGTWLSIMDAQ
jgi:hypothetical protein